MKMPNQLKHGEADCLVDCPVCDTQTECHWQGVLGDGSEEYRCCECGTLFNPK